MKTLPIFTGDLEAGWRSLVAWSVAIIAVLCLYLPIYPSMNTPQLTQMIQALPAELTQALGYDQITSGQGYTQATFFGLMGFVLIAIAAISWGAAAIAGEEESGQLELTLAHSVGRVQYALETAGALVVKLVLLGAVATVVITVLNSPSELGIGSTELFAEIFAWVGLGLLCGCAALAAGALTGRRAWAIVAGAAVAVLGYAFNALGNMSSNVEWLKYLSPYDWAYRNTPLLDGFDWGGLALLWGLSLVLIVVSAVALARRDIKG
ncbi:ABC transporter permease subunit [Corynebacterium lubricantis]|uniref:ABC transporter permease subunit n=1 Tax=Corynebacterium lubricantis TaxID=541095 RepID=UPI000371C054|nr:ABC transporter permease subunit [Corynebacterium lubricantis]